MARPDYLHDDLQAVFREERENHLLGSARLRTSAENKLLDSAEDQGEFKRLRSVAPSLVADADSPIDEVSFADYKLRRELELQGPARPEAEQVRGMSFAEYEKWRNRVSLPTVCDSFLVWVVQKAGQSRIEGPRGRSPADHPPHPMRTNARRERPSKNPGSFC